GETGASEPRVALFTYLFSPDNPLVPKLDQDFRALEEKFRDTTCLDCHSPDNSYEMPRLTLLTYPNQALGDRHYLVSVLEDDAMPPLIGMKDDALRHELLDLAREFAQTGDEALAFEG